MPQDTLYSITGVQVFASGTWNDDTYTDADLDEMVRAFHYTREKIRPALKLGHNDEQTLAQKDGMPAVGYIGNLYRVGDKLVADFEDIPEKIYKLLSNRAYTKVSSEIYWDFELGGTDMKFGYLLGAVALLGEDIPAVQNLDDIIALYDLKFESIKSYAKIENDLNMKTYSIDTNQDNSRSAMPISEKEHEELKAKLEKSENESKQYQLDKLKVEKELAETKEKQSETDKTIAQYKAEIEESNTNVFIAELEKDKLAVPGMKPYIKALLGENKKSYSVSAKEGEKGKEKEVQKNYDNKRDLLKDMLKVFSSASEVNLQTRSLDGTEGAQNNTEALDKEIKEYMSKNKVDYSKAYRAVLKKHKTEE